MERTCTKLPANVEIEILSRLPVKSLLRFKCVCKSWLSLIENPSFISKHLQLSRHKNNNCQLILVRGTITESSTVSLLSSELQVSTDVDYLPIILGARVLIMGSCDGIICICMTRDIYYIWNPATKEVKSVPIPPKVGYPSYIESQMRTSVFGFDSKNNDYKVVRIVEARHMLTEQEVVPNVVQIYSLRSNSWRELTDHRIFPAQEIRVPHHNTNINGFYNWIVRDPEGYFAILSFDMSNEVFSTTRAPLPPTFPIPPYSLVFACFNGSFALFVYDSCDTKYPSFKWRNDSTYIDSPPIFGLEIWMLTKLNVDDVAAWTWSKHSSVGPLEGILRIVAILEGKKQLLLENWQREFILYDFQTQQLQNLQIYGLPLDSDVTIYNESLVPIG